MKTVRGATIVDFAATVKQILANGILTGESWYWNEKNGIFIYMYQFFIGLGLGIYVGTYYDCKPVMKTLGEHIKNYLPPKK